ncbi:MAG: chemotaxis protein CheW, partial [Coriobacteriia bacterium]|nr:chemotaxis protein CheW [Coriobacteriia bacterium]
SRKKDTQAPKAKTKKRPEATETDESVGPDVSVDGAPVETLVSEEPDTGESSAAEVAVGTAMSPGSPAIERIVAFHLAGQRYALPIEVVQEIQQIVAFSEVPSQGGPVVGMINLRGAVIPAVDMRALIGMPREEYTLETPMVISRAHDGLVALIVDSVDDVIQVPEGCVQPVSSMHSLADRMLGVCQIANDLVYLLDIARIVTPVNGLAD